MGWIEGLNDAMDYIEANLEGDLAHAHAARLAACTEGQFRRMFSYIAGIGLMEYVRRRRISRAALTSTERSGTPLGFRPARRSARVPRSRSSRGSRSPSPSRVPSPCRGGSSHGTACASSGCRFRAGRPRRPLARGRGGEPRLPRAARHCRRAHPRHEVMLDISSAFRDWPEVEGFPSASRRSMTGSPRRKSVTEGLAKRLRARRAHARRGAPEGGTAATDSIICEEKTNQPLQIQCGPRRPRQAAR